MLGLQVSFVSLLTEILEMCRQLLALTMLLVPIGCVTPRTSTWGLGDVAAWSAPPLNRAVSVRDGWTGEVVSFDAFLDVLADAVVVFLGETHTDETTHRVELAVYEGLLERRRGGVVLAMEMFERDVQQDLDSYLAGEINEAAFLDSVRPWGHSNVQNVRPWRRCFLHRRPGRGWSIQS